jgi:hypothetical protein
VDPVSGTEHDDLNVADPFRWLSPREIIEGDDGPELGGDRQPRPRTPRTPSSAVESEPTTIDP